MLVDTDVLIWYMRGNEKALRVIMNLRNFSISVVTYMELVQGLRNKEELNILRNSLKKWNAGIIYINEEISTKAMFLVEQYYLSHSIQLADALVGATAVIYGRPLLTANTKHYMMIKNIIVKKFRP
ncbi:MAG: type II toxin-antitoxin system VapC family toxin [Desulfobacteraceae bacterium]|jgi:predicted nucleic acid-binding protein